MSCLPWRKSLSDRNPKGLQTTSPAAPVGQTNSQLQSTFFGRVPAEIRQFIFEYAVGGETYHLHIHGRSQSIWSRTCYAPDMCPIRPYHNCEPRADDEPMGRPANRHLLGVLLSCRRSYYEAITLLYTHNAFITSSDGCLELLPRLIHPSHLVEIKRFSFGLRYSKHPPRPDLKAPFDYKTHQWIDIWRNVAGMKGLETLCVVIGVPPFWSTGIWAKFEDVIFAPLRAVTAPTSVDLYLPWADEDVPSTVEELPCRVHREADDGMIWPAGPSWLKGVTHR